MADVESIVIREIYGSIGWVDLYQIHARYLLPPLEIFDCCDRLLGKGVLEIKERNVRITESGRIWAIKNRHAIFSSARPWAKASSYLQTKKQQPATPYLPNLRLLDKGFFQEILHSDSK